MSDIFSGVGQVAGAAISASAMKKATQMQIDALQKQRDFVFSQLDPALLGPKATAADVDRLKNQLALQAEIDPELLAQRYAAERAITQQAAQLGAGGAADVAAAATKEALAGGEQNAEAKKALIDAALGELRAGATLPPDVQAELVQAGLQKTGQVQGIANTSGVGGQVLSTILGIAGINLKAQRQERAANLLKSAQDLENSRQTLLTNLFPNLSSMQLNNLKGQQSILAQSNAMAPAAGLGGTDIVNLWLSRVGATNQLAQTQANAAAEGARAQGQIWGNTVANVAPYIGAQLPSTSTAANWLGRLFSPSPTPESLGSYPTQYSMSGQPTAYSAVF